MQGEELLLLLTHDEPRGVQLVCLLVQVFSEQSETVGSSLR